MEIETLRSKSKDELLALLEQHKKEALNLRFQRVSGELENTTRMRTVRRIAARVKTVLREQHTAHAAKKKES